MTIGQWSDDMSWWTVHWQFRARLGEQNETSGEVCCVLGLKGLRVGVSVLFRVISESSWSMTALPLRSALCVVSQEGSCALRSPSAKVLVVVLR